MAGGGAAGPKTTELRISRICVAERLSVCVMPHRHPSSINIFSKKLERKLNCDFSICRILLIYTESSYYLELYVCMFPILYTFMQIIFIWTRCSNNREYRRSSWGHQVL